MLKLGILRETKPNERRTPLAPIQCKEIMEKFPNVEVFVQSSPVRIFTDEDYERACIHVKDDLSDCDILLGIKEMDPNTLIPDKKYIFFSHTAKKQPHNRHLLQEILKRKIHLIDLELLTDKNNIRVIAFGRFAGIVGAYNGLIAYGKRYKLPLIKSATRYELRRAYELFNIAELFEEVKKVKLLPNTKILITGTGRVGKGALETFAPLNLKLVSHQDFLTKNFDEPVLCIIDADVYTRRKDGSVFNFQHFFKNPQMYESAFLSFTKVTDFFISCHFWDPLSPILWTKKDMKSEDFKIKIIADITCDIHGSVPSTIRASTIESPFYGYNPLTEQEGEPFDENNITVMAVDNLPSELPRDASEFFGENLIKYVFPFLLGNDSDGMIERASITKNGKLTEKFSYLADYVID